MFSLTRDNEYFFFNQSTDMRMSFDSLSGLIRNQFQMNPLNGQVFLFMNKRRNQIKLLQWQLGGFMIYYKKLEKGTFSFSPENNINATYSLKWTDLVMAFEGVRYKEISRQSRFSLSID